jgi:hypothetical protein
MLNTSAQPGTLSSNPSQCARHEARAFDRVQSLSNDQLMSQVVQLNRKQYLLVAELLLYLGELDGRKLYRKLACSSLFDYLTARLGQSEDVAYRRMWGARLLRAYPLAYALLADAKLHLSALMLLKPHLTEENHREWLLAAAGKSKREVERMLAARCPKADVPTRVRRLPEPVPTRVSELLDPALGQGGGSQERACTIDSLSPTVPSMTATASAPVKSSGPSLAAVPRPSLPEPLSIGRDLLSRATKVQPLSEHSYRVVFTASERLKEKLDRATELLCHTIAPTDLPALVERALDLLIEREERRRYGSSRVAQPVARGSRGSIASPASASAPASASRSESGPRSESASCAKESVSRPSAASRHLPARVRREVWERDGGQCSYVDEEGRRCQSRHFLEFDHRVAHALGGPPTVENIRLRCRSHNILAAEQVFGLERITDAVSSARERHHRTGAKTHRTGAVTPRRDGTPRDARRSETTTPGDAT